MGGPVDQEDVTDLARMLCEQHEELIRHLKRLEVLVVENTEEIKKVRTAVRGLDTQG